MSDPNWTAVDHYIEAQLLGRADPTLAAALAANTAAGLPSIDVSPAQGKFLHLLAKIAGARRVLEIGTLGGYSTIWLASALPDGGRLVSLEFQQSHAEVARANLARAGLEGRAEVIVGAALDSLPALESRGEGPFDFVFIDADKPNNAHYLEWAVRLGRPGTVIVLDNVVRGGRLLDSDSADRSVQGSREAFELVKMHPRLDATALQTVGAKGWDGFVLAMVR